MAGQTVIQRAVSGPIKIEKTIMICKKVEVLPAQTGWIWTCPVIELRKSRLFSVNNIHPILIVA
ncbi:MAG: hypothetical protein J7K65_01805 [Planctomycetes bacterium]|nr:hypothetical protein [Planctomycetota bacterium]